MTETPMLEAEAPNAPEWAFAAEIPAEEQERLKEEMIAGFKTVFDPEIPCDIYELGLIYRVGVDESRQVAVDMTLTAPGCPVAGELTLAVESVVGAISGTSGVDVRMVFDPPWDQRRMSDEARTALDFY
ncbi:MAG TPA: iron-sulfur cluster assembly protein [Methylovirgula sp.]|nr:iron-sulfur cluster assembly protein [Methylovirgula sp.]